MVFTPEQSEQVEVVEKRVEISSSHGRRVSRKYYSYYVAFKFPDGTIKEFKVDHISTRDFKKEINSSVYDSIFESDTGILTYKELENAENRFFSPTNYREFHSFEKDLICGGTKVETGVIIHKPGHVWSFPILSILLNSIVVYLTVSFKRKEDKIIEEKRKKEEARKRKREIRYQQKREEERERKRSKNTSKTHTPRRRP